ncbi:hypothetical protein EGH21_19570 [Halomicroarcula sp. F13]|uniref:Uncharacterized protein n=1 Tax=Haloarcula rubra TaxID=2487747 RepID=A0AAW4PYQ2_9EURY|nr:hypothetical protein [Halomicroarcula rubra]MBX0325229.1 hypothetical protein [Halomicroarcula rubra]
MQAQSLVVGARALDRRADALLAKQRLEPTSTRRQGLAQLSTLSTLNALIAAGTPLPVPGTTDSENGLVRRLLERLYADGDLSLAALDESLCNRAAQIDRVTTAGPILIIPLGLEGTARHNWRPVFRLLIDRLDDTEAKCDRVVARTETLSSASVAHRTWQSTVETVRETRDLLRTQLARQERLRRLYTKPADEPAEFAAWTIDQLTDATTEP